VETNYVIHTYGSFEYVVCLELTGKGMGTHFDAHQLPGVDIVCTIDIILNIL